MPSRFWMVVPMRRVSQPYIYDLDSNAVPVNRRMIVLARTGVPDAIHTDDTGRIWTAKDEGVVVRSARRNVFEAFDSQSMRYQCDDICGKLCFGRTYTSDPRCAETVKCKARAEGHKPC
jgi:sugar lactone lactonase YvrE